MNELLDWIGYIEDISQEKSTPSIKGLNCGCFIFTLANVDDWFEMEYFDHYHKEYLKRYVELKNRISSLGTLCRAIRVISSEVL